MSGAIFYSGRYGSTEQYARWIAEDTGLPVFAIHDAEAEPSQHDFVVLGSSVVFYRATIRKWAMERWPALRERPLLLFTVSGAGPGEKLDGWVEESFPAHALAHMEHVGLRGRLRHEDVSWWLRLALKVGSLFNRDPEAAKDERYGFDYVDRATIGPVVEWVRGHRSGIRPQGVRDERGL